MAAAATGTGGLASKKSLKPMEASRPQAKKAAVSLHDDRDLECNVKSQSLKVCIPGASSFSASASFRYPVFAALQVDKYGSQACSFV